MRHHRKLVVAIVGVALIQAAHWTGVDYSAAAPAIVDAVLSAGLLLGVWGAANDPAGA